jgi:carbon storage regulator
MLVLSRKLGEEIVVPALQLRFKVLSVEGKTVRLGVTAPADVAVHRQEVWDRIRQLLKASPGSKSGGARVKQLEARDGIR